MNAVTVSGVRRVSEKSASSKWGLGSRLKTGVMIRLGDARCWAHHGIDWKCIISSVLCVLAFCVTDIFSFFFFYFF